MILVHVDTIIWYHDEPFIWEGFLRLILSNFSWWGSKMIGKVCVEMVLYDSSNQLDNLLSCVKPHIYISGEDWLSSLFRVCLGLGMSRLWD